MPRENDNAAAMEANETDIDWLEVIYDHGGLAESS